jgi:hypothetical protein
MLDPAFRAALDEADRGQRKSAFGRLAELRSRDPEVKRACEMAVISRLWLTGAEQQPLPSRDELAEFVGRSAESCEAAALACSAAAMSCILRLDQGELKAHNSLGAALLASRERGVAVGWLRLCEAWAELIAGSGTSLDAKLESVRSEAVEAKAAVLAVECAAVRALAAINDGDIAEATERARRASRMARTEAIPRAEFMAHLVLARMRRISGKPHLAARILSSLLELAAPPWHPWMLWELMLAGGYSDASRLEVAPPWPLLNDVLGLLSAAESGNRDSFDRTVAQVRATAAPWSWLVADVEILAQVIDPELDLASLDRRVVDWVRGQTALTPYGLHGLCANPELLEADEAAVAYVVAGPGRQPRRILLHGLELVRDAAVRVAQMRRRSGRLDTAAAALALAAAEGMESTEFFRAVYGFAYTPEIHRGVIKTLVHRLRTRLEDVACIHSEAGRLQFEPLTPMILPDPRCAAALNDRVLWLLSTHRGLSAREAAQRLNLPLRTVQTALHELVEDGSCESLRTGRSVSYEVEDTTFSEPTLVLRRRGKLRG